MISLGSFILHLAQPDRMWIEVRVGTTTAGQPYVTSYQAEDEEQVEVQETATSPSLLQFIASKAKVTEADLVSRGTWKINIKMSDYEKHFRQLSSSKPFQNDNSQDIAMLMERMLKVQASQIEQHGQLLAMLTETLRANNGPKAELVKPDMFDGTTASATTWLKFFEYACEKNCWLTSQDKVQNMRLFLVHNAKKWYELRITDHPDDTWDHWRVSFISAFDQNPVDRWDKAIFFKQRSSSLIDYFYEKRRLLLLADPTLPESSIVPLVIHGMTKECQRQVQIRSPKTVEDLLGCLKDVYHEAPGPVAQHNWIHPARVHPDNTATAMTASTRSAASDYFPSNRDVKETKNE